MAEYINIDHIDQFFSMPDSRQKEFKQCVREYMKAHPFIHISTDWGRFQGMHAGYEEAKKKAEEIVGSMTLEQKVNQMSGDYTPAQSECAFERYNCTPFYAGEDVGLDIPGIKFTDGPSGIVLGYHSTAFPVSMARAATFDPELEEAVGNAIGIEGRAQGANLFAGVCINLLRHPGWGRAQETYGEDPYLLGVMGSALIKGVQKHMMACVKHFCANSMENSRFLVDVTMDEQTLREVYLPHFKKCIDVGVCAVMSAYNRFRGNWCGHNSYLLRDILKKEWGFQGFVMSDFGYGIRGTVEPAKAGLDLEMNNTQYYGRRLVAAVKEGLVPESHIDEAAVRLLTRKIEYAGIGQAPSFYSPDKVACAEHIALAKRAAQESIVLLKNDGLLPLCPEKIKRLLVVGDIAKVGAIGDSKGSSAVFPPYVIDYFTGIRENLPDTVQVDFIRGVVSDEVRQRAKEADAVLVCAGLTYLDEGEYFEDAQASTIGGDRKSLALSGLQQDMILAASEGNPNTIVAIQGGSAVEMESIKQHAAAILIVWYAGMEGGNALAEILFGKVNPSGKLPVSIYKNEQDLPYFGLSVENIHYDFYHGYFAADQFRYPLTYPFGFGLSYTEFALSEQKAWRETVDDKPIIHASARITNTGSRVGTEVLQLYIGYKNSAARRHVKDLKAFKRVTLPEGDSRTVVLSVPESDLAYYNTETGKWVTEEICYIAYIGTSSSLGDLMAITV